MKAKLLKKLRKRFAIVRGRQVILNAPTREYLIAFDKKTCRYIEQGYGESDRRFLLSLCIDFISVSEYYDLKDSRGNKKYQNQLKRKFNQS